MLKNSFHQYGVISKVFHYIILVLMIVIYVLEVRLVLHNKPWTTSMLLQFEMLMFVVALLYSIWTLFNRRVMSFAMTNIEEKTECLVIFLLNAGLIIMPALNFSAYCLNVALNIANDPNFVYTGYHMFGHVVANYAFVKGYGTFLAVLWADPGLFQHSIAKLHKLFIEIIVPSLFILRTAFVLYNYFIRRTNIIGSMFGKVSE